MIGVTLTMPSYESGKKDGIDKGYQQGYNAAMDDIITITVNDTIELNILYNE